MKFTKLSSLNRQKRQGRKDQRYRSSRGHQPESDGTPGPPRDLILAFFASWRSIRTGLSSPLSFTWRMRLLATSSLVEDESLVRSLVDQVLKRSGYTVLEAQHGAEVLRIVLQHPGPIHLLLTDLVMPLMGGRDLAKRLLGMRNDIKVLYMSAYTDDSSIRQDELEPGTDFIQKPFTPDSLSRKVRGVLDS